MTTRRSPVRARLGPLRNTLPCSGSVARDFGKPFVHGGVFGLDFVRVRCGHAAVGTPYLPKPITGDHTADGVLIVPKSFMASAPMELEPVFLAA